MHIVKSLLPYKNESQLTNPSIHTKEAKTCQASGAILMFSSIKADSLGEKTDCSKCIAQFQILGIQLCVTHK